ncbi:peptidoglycan D,D-transpeptidase FtsI family protein [Paenibacillus xylaniclasticus]|uniref:peptidoglycan D,D-transpeptidase FtsI family protein n=1 Tax=Paenibacillus xylaniclasticus TaxID=588083 RepID=UPI001752901C|nr:MULTISPECIES: penicillin-binding protein 2 [Paenibacillus]GFN33560.1 penicillin-binding protein 4B [Paenibacillus curdlanolyticus]
MRRRLLQLGMMMTVLFGIYIWRLGMLELWPAANRSTAGNVVKQSVAQRDEELILDTGRGDFVDRYGERLTGETIQALAVFPLASHARGDRSQLERMADILGVTYEQLQSYLVEVKQPGYWKVAGVSHPAALSDEQVKQFTSIRVNGVRVVPYRLRYIEPYLAAHTLGFISQHPERVKTVYGHEYASGKIKLNAVVGSAGLELSLDRLLRGGKETRISYYTDAAGQPLHGLGLRVTGPHNPMYPLTVVTTLDAKLQSSIEAYVDRQELTKGAVVVLDAGNADIVAIVSRPKLNPEQIGLPGTDTVNRALRAVEPGSIFKLVTEAAALEAGVSKPNEAFHCTGEYGRYGLTDWKQGGHGHLTLREGLAYSCNIVFATIAERLSPQQLLDTADRLGLGQQIGWSSKGAVGPLAGPLRLLPEEEAGVIVKTMPVSFDGGLMAQTGIGQRDVRVSPLQAANMIVSILNQGRVLEPRIVSELKYANGQRLAKLPVQAATAPNGRVSPATARELMNGMELVVKSGTGQSIQDGIWEAAGKSGTAEVIRDGEYRVNQWFIGYGPIRKPRYAIAVLVEDRPPDSVSEARRLFRGVLDIAAQQQ